MTDDSGEADRGVTGTSDAVADHGVTGTSDAVADAVDVLVVGGGPAGVSAATWVGRYQRSTVLVDAGAQRNLSARRIHGMLGTGPTTPAEFYADINTGLDEYPTVRRLGGAVTSLIKDSDDRFLARIAPSDGDGQIIVTAKRIILATGVRDRLPDIAGIEEHYGVDVHHCPACDGLTAAGRRVIVLGAGAHVPAYASELLDWASEVVIITESDSDPSFDDDQRAACAEHQIEVIDGVARELVGVPDALDGVRLADGRVIAGSRVFFSYAHHPTNELATSLGCETDDEGGLVVNALQLTSVDGVYAAGDIVTGLQLVPIAVGTGAAAGVACATSLRGHATAPDVPDPAPPTRNFTRPTD
ncbi:NAD(P)/FAD-dependent oxidoreductase [Dietzia sp. NPDC055343]